MRGITVEPNQEALVQRLVDLDDEPGAPFDEAAPGASQVTVEPEDIGYGVRTCGGCGQRVPLYVMGVMCAHYVDGKVCGWSHT